MVADRNSNIIDTLQRTSTNIIDNQPSETQVKTKELCLDQNFSVPLRKAGVTVVSIASNFCKFIGININSNQSEEMNNKAFCDIISDDVKFRALKEDLRNKGLATNVAIKQYLLEYDKAPTTFEFEQQCKKCSYDQSRSMIKKDKNGYKWNLPSKVAVCRFQNIKAERSAYHILR